MRMVTLPLQPSLRASGPQVHASPPEKLFCAQWAVILTEPHQSISGPCSRSPSGPRLTQRNSPGPNPPVGCVGSFWAVTDSDGVAAPPRGLPGRGGENQGVLSLSSLLSLALAPPAVNSEVEAHLGRRDSRPGQLPLGSMPLVRPPPALAGNCVALGGGGGTGAQTWGSLKAGLDS